eukprot:246017-Rhodomonas_salina.2
MGNGLTRSWSAPLICLCPCSDLCGIAFGTTADGQLSLSVCEKGSRFARWRTGRMKRPREEQPVCRSSSVCSRATTARYQPIPMSGTDAYLVYAVSSADVCVLPTSPLCDVRYRRVCLRLTKRRYGPAMRCPV